MMENIVNVKSSQDELFRRIRKLVRNSSKRRDDLLLIEGKRQLLAALESGLEAEYLIFAQNTDGEVLIREVLAKYPQKLKPVGMKPSLFAELAETRNSQGIIMLAPMPPFEKEPATLLAAGGSVLILENVQDPGNTGTLIRTAAAFGFSAVIITDGGCQPFNDKALRASMGAVFRLSLLTDCCLADIIPILRNHHYQLFAADMKGQPVHETEVSEHKNIALLLGNEGAGISELARADFQLVSVPMTGAVESLNVAMAGTILCWELFRQRKRS
ncbi:MAG: TrmH family RNA methyltransferase [Saccharofermentanales bacterium]|nr:RNA methyltransferase [Bacillota bacterium]NLB08639.1 RNA methyltransferase [Clostridiales bacterium]